MKLSEWIQQTNKFLRQDGLKLPQEIIDELRDQQRFVLLDFDTQTLFTAKVDLEEYPQIFEAPTSFQPPPMFYDRPILFDEDFQVSVGRVRKETGFDWDKEPNHKLNEAYAIRAGLEEQNAILDRLTEQINQDHHNDRNSHPKKVWVNPTIISI